MQQSDILIIDTGCANIASLDFAIARLGYQTTISADPELIYQAKKLFLPGVGSAQEAMKNLNKRGLDELIPTLTQPLLGICLGMQLLARISYENQLSTSCLNIIEAEVKPLETHGHPLPHMGWNTVEQNTHHPLFKNIAKESYFYFVHSYGIEQSTYTIANCDYGLRFSAAVQWNNFYGVQFHPERSGKDGAILIQNFIEM